MPKKTVQKRDGVYKRTDRKGFWISWVDAQGRRRQRKTDAGNITQAKNILAAELLRVEQAKILGHAPPSEDTFGEVAKRYLKYQKARLSEMGYAREEGILRNHMEQFNPLKLSAIRKADIQRYVTERAAEVSAYSVRRELATITHLFSFAVEEGIISDSPAQKVKAPKLPAGRVRYLQPTELKALLEACPVGLREVVALAVSTGMRRSEILSLRHLDVDRTNRLVRLPQTKNGDGRIVHLNAMALMVIESMPTGAPGARIFAGLTPGQVTMTFGRICVRLKIPDFRFHDLRHTAASWMRMGGADIHTVAELLGHKHLSMAKRYQHLSPAFLADAVGKLDAIFGDAVGLKTVENEKERDRSVTGVSALTDGTDGNS